MDKQTAYAVPADIMHKHLPALRTTDDKYWHVDLSDAEDGHVAMFLAKTREMVSLTPYALSLGSPSA